MQRRIYAPNVYTNDDFGESNNTSIKEDEIFHQKPFNTPSNAAKRLLEAIKKIEIKCKLNGSQYDDHDCIDLKNDYSYYSNSQQSDEYDYSYYSNSQQSDEYSSYDDDNNSYEFSDNQKYFPDSADLLLLESPRNDQEFARPRQSRLNHQFQRITKNQEMIKSELQKIKNDVENLDNEYELMETNLDLSF